MLSPPSIDNPYIVLPTSPRGGMVWTKSSIVDMNSMLKQFESFLSFALSMQNERKLMERCSGTGMART
jgi:hypothetical protein